MESTTSTTTVKFLLKQKHEGHTKLNDQNIRVRFAARKLNIFYNEGFDWMVEFKKVK